MEILVHRSDGTLESKRYRPSWKDFNIGDHVRYNNSMPHEHNLHCGHVVGFEPDRTAHGSCLIMFCTVKPHAPIARQAERLENWPEEKCERHGV